MRIRKIIFKLSRRSINSSQVVVSNHPSFLNKGNQDSAFLLGEKAQTLAMPKSKFKVSKLEPKSSLKNKTAKIMDSRKLQ